MWIPTGKQISIVLYLWLVQQKTQTEVEIHARCLHLFMIWITKEEFENRQGRFTRFSHKVKNMARLNGLSVR